jgi:acetyl-CoA C-acetyltransferase
MADVFIYDVIRTPRGRGKAGKGGLSQLHPQELLAQTLNRMADRLHLDKGTVDDLAIGCVTQVKEQGACIARNALIAAQWPDDVTGFTINRFCGSGLEAVNSIAAKIGAGYIDAGVGGGVESMSRVPMGADGAMLDGLNEQLRKRVFIVPQGISADLIATREGFTRADVDAFALASQQKAARAIEEQRFARSLFTGQPRRHAGGARPRRAPAARHHRRVAGGSWQPAFTQLGATRDGPRRRDRRSALALKVYPDTGDRARPHRRQLERHRRRRRHSC